MIPDSTTARTLAGLVASLLLSPLAAPFVAGSDAVRHIETAPAATPSAADRAGSTPTSSRRRSATADANPLADHPWGVYQGPLDQAWNGWSKTTGTERELLRRFVDQPRAQWFGNWVPQNQVAERVHTYVENATGGDPDVLVHMALFRMVPWEGAACQRLPTKKEQVAYRRWITTFAAALDQTYAAVILQPDGPFAACAPGGSTLPSRMIAWTSQVLSRLPHVTTYIDIGSSGWVHQDPAYAAKLLVRAGVADARGFHLNTTHFESVDSQVRFGSQVVKALADAGVPGRHFTVDTAENGKPFTFQEMKQKYGQKATYETIGPCRSARETHCSTLGIPPTTDVAARRWGLHRDVRTLARADVDAYLWGGRPWLNRPEGTWNRKRAVNVCRFTPFQD